MATIPKASQIREGTTVARPFCKSQVFFGRRLADEVHAMGEIQPRGLRLEGGGFRPAAGNDQIQVAAVAKQGHRLQQHVIPFCRASRPMKRK